MIKRDLSFDTRQLAWLAGLMEGEGSFARGSPAKPRRPTTSIGMSDDDIIRRVCDLWGTQIWKIEAKNARHKPAYRTELVGGSAVAMMSLLRPHLCARRQTQIDEAVATFQPLRPIKHKRFFVSPEGEEEFDRYWLAGLLEGEAYFGLNKTARHTISPMVELNTVDRDVILRVQRLYAERYGISVNVHVRPPRHEGYQPQYHLACYGPAARAIMVDLAPLLGQRRRARVAELLGASEGAMAVTTSPDRAGASTDDTDVRPICRCGAHAGLRSLPERPGSERKAVASGDVATTLTEDAGLMQRPWHSRAPAALQKIGRKSA